MMADTRWALALRFFDRRRLGLVAAGALTALGPRSGPAKKTKKKKKPPPKPILTASCQQLAAGTLTGAARFAQTFVASRGGTLHEIRVAIEKRTDQPPGNYIIQVVPTTGTGVPRHEAHWVFAAAGFDDEDVSIGNTTLVARFAGTSLLAGLTYGLVVSRIGPGQLTMRIGTCSDTGLFSAFGDQPFEASQGGGNLVFSVFVL